MPTPIPSIVDNMSTALSIASLQHQVIASNIANRDTQGYQRLQLRFAQAMGEASAVAVTADAPEVPVSLEQDLVALSANSAHYAALARVLTRYLSIIGSITNYSRG
jgi:flagellar basal body rod protein FlgB